MNILVVEPQQSMADAIASSLTRFGHTPLFAASLRSLKNIPETSYQMMIVDTSVVAGDVLSFLRNNTRVPVVLMSSTGGVREAEEATRGGAVDFLIKPFHPKDLKNAVEKCLPRGEESTGNVYKDSINPDEWPSIRTNKNMQRLARIYRSICDSSVTVLISGESGTGKEIVARRIHESSPHSKGPFIAINCAAIPENLLEAELFGHERGAFTGAINSRVGKFEMARDGSILLDEISEMDLSLQAKLLRVLQEREFYSVGGSHPIRVKARVMATTNRDLRKCVEDGTFREDLFYRLHVIPIAIPPLRERLEDIAALTDFFMKRNIEQINRRSVRFSKAALDAINSYPWHGNIRELENTITRAFLLCDAEEISVEDLGLFHQPSSVARSSDSDMELMPLHEMEKALILKALKFHEGNRTHAATSLGISLRTLRNKINEYQTEGISIPAPLSAGNN